MKPCLKFAVFWFALAGLTSAVPTQQRQASPMQSTAKPIFGMAWPTAAIEEFARKLHENNAKRVLRIGFPGQQNRYSGNQNKFPKQQNGLPSQQNEWNVKGETYPMGTSGKVREHKLIGRPNPWNNTQLSYERNRMSLPFEKGVPAQQNVRRMPPNATPTWPRKQNSRPVQQNKSEYRRPTLMQFYSRFNENNGKPSPNTAMSRRQKEKPRKIASHSKVKAVRKTQYEYVPSA